MPKIRHPERMPRSYRKRQIMRFLESVKNHDGECCGISALDIAEHLGIQKSTHLSAMLDEMAEAGDLRKYPTVWLNGWDMWIYTHRECQLEQLELFHDLES